MASLKTKELSILTSTVSMLEAAVSGEQMSKGDNGKVDLNGLHTAVKILKTVREMEQEILRGADEKSVGGVVILPETEEKTDGGDGA